MFFQDIIGTSSCELLRPYFTKEATTVLPIKEYIENNSAIAVGLDALGFVNKELVLATNRNSLIESAGLCNIEPGTVYTPRCGIWVAPGRRFWVSPSIRPGARRAPAPLRAPDDGRACRPQRAWRGKYSPSSERDRCR